MTWVSDFLRVAWQAVRKAEAAYNRQLPSHLEFRLNGPKSTRLVSSDPLVFYKRLGKDRHLHIELSVAAVLTSKTEIAVNVRRADREQLVAGMPHLPRLVRSADHSRKPNLGRIFWTDKDIREQLTTGARDTVEIEVAAPDLSREGLASLQEFPHLQSLFVRGIPLPHIPALPRVEFLSAKDVGPLPLESMERFASLQSLRLENLVAQGSFLAPNLQDVHLQGIRSTSSKWRTPNLASLWVTFGSMPEFELGAESLRNLRLINCNVPSGTIRALSDQVRNKGLHVIEVKHLPLTTIEELCESGFQAPRLLMFGSDVEPRHVLTLGDEKIRDAAMDARVLEGVLRADNSWAPRRVRIQGVPSPEVLQELQARGIDVKRLRYPV